MTRYKQYKTQQIQVHILPKHPHNCQNTHTYTHPYITKQVKTATVQEKSGYERSGGQVINGCEGIVKFNRHAGHGQT